MHSAHHPFNAPGLLARRDADGPVAFAHAGLSGLSPFGKASYWGMLQ
ncbi:hypothetical protein [Burkholderia metallica]|nr:hypothetical protein [Burkholderia metallica]